MTQPFKVDNFPVDIEKLRTVSVRHRWIILLAIGLIAAVEISNRVSINVLLPDMQGNVAANSDEISWVLILYNIGYLSSMALTAAMSRYLGARRQFLFSVALYSLGAIGCFLSSHHLMLLLVSRVVMGFGGGSFLVRMIVISLEFFPGSSRTNPLIWTVALQGCLQIFYPTAMGWINDASHWNYAFLIDLPFLALGSFVIWKLLPPGKFRFMGKSRLDVRGMLLLIGSMATLQTALSRGERDYWLESNWIAAFLLTGVVLFVLFVLWEAHPANDVPVLHLRRIWKNRQLRGSFALVMALGAVLGTGLFVYPQYARTVQDFSATQTGKFFSIYGAGLGVALVFNLGYLLPRWGALRVSLLGFSLLIAVFGTFVYLWTPDTPTYLLGLVLFALGFGTAIALFGVSRLATSELELSNASDTYTTFYFVRQLGNSLGVTAATILLDRRMSLHSSRLLDTANRLDPTTRIYLRAYEALVARNGGAGSTPGLGAIQLFQGNVVTQTKLLAYVDISAALVALCILSLILIAVSQREVRRSLMHLHWW